MGQDREVPQPCWDRRTAVGPTPSEYRNNHHIRDVVPLLRTPYAAGIDPNLKFSEVKLLLETKPEPPGDASMRPCRRLFLAQFPAVKLPLALRVFLDHPQIGCLADRHGGLPWSRRLRVEWRGMSDSVVGPTASLIPRHSTH